jgi:tetratricopeptide (TPR) repeat protein
MNKRYLVYLNNKNKRYLPENRGNVLMQIRSLLQNFSGIEARDARISSYFVEIDLSLYNVEQQLFQHSIIAGLNSIGSLIYYDDLSESKPYSNKKNVLDNAIFLFNMERFWKSHEVLEEIWKESIGIEKRILNGIILIDAAFVHYQKNEYNIFISILKRSLDKLRESSGMFYTLNLDEIKENLNKIIDKSSDQIFKIFTY